MTSFDVVNLRNGPPLHYDLCPECTEASEEFFSAGEPASAAVKTQPAQQQQRASRDRPAVHEQITDLYLQGYSTTEIAAYFGVVPSTISRILRKSGIQMRPGGTRGLGSPELPPLA